MTETLHDSVTLISEFLNNYNNNNNQNDDDDDDEVKPLTSGKSRYTLNYV